MNNNERIVSNTINQVAALSNSIKEGLENGQHYTELLDELIQTTDDEKVLSSTVALTKLDLTNAFVQLPQHYQDADYFLLMMDRLLSLHNIDGFEIAEDSDHHLRATLHPFEKQVTFSFQYDAEHQGAFFNEGVNHESLFFIEPAKRQLRFSNHALVDFFVENEYQHFSDLDLQKAVRPLIDFANLLQDHLNFTIDLGILNPANDCNIRLAKPALDLTMIDKLFVATSDSDSMLFTLPHNNGALLKLKSGIELRIFYDKESYSQEWFYNVKDGEEKVSFFDLLIHDQLLRDWYLTNREAVAARSLPLILQSAPAAAEQGADQETASVPEEEEDQHED